MTRSRINLLAYAVLTVAVAACGSSKSSDESKSAHAASSGEDSDNDGGPSGSTSSTKTGGSSKSDAGSATSGKTGDTKAEAGSGGSGGKGSDDGKASSSNNLPNDGNQLSLCSMAQGDCNKGLACSGSASPVAESRDYCSKICETDDDCKDVTPSSAKYTCSTGRGTKLCEIACSGSDDTSCPDNMKCTQTGVTVERPVMGGAGGAGGSGGAGGAGGAAGRNNPFVPVYHCKYPLITSPLWGPCQDGAHQCDKDAVCYGSAPDRAGVCTKSCSMDSDCGDKPSSGDITPSCATITAARGNMMETKLCVLSCLDKKDGCPDGTSCVDGPRASNGRGGMNMGPGRGQGMMGPMGTMGNGGSGSESAPAYARCE